MPHFGLMKTDELGPDKAALQRARLHIRSGKRRLRQGMVAAGIVTLYDALDHALDWYLLAGNDPGADLRGSLSRKDSRFVYQALVGKGILDGAFDYDAFDALTERALHEELPDFDYRELVVGIDSVMTHLGVMPFREDDLPPESPESF